MFADSVGQLGKKTKCVYLGTKVYTKTAIMKYILYLFFIFMCCFCSASAQDTSLTIHPYLKKPFGNIVKLEVEIVDGESLQEKYYQSSFLFRVFSVDSVALALPVVMEFKDETGRFPDDIFNLHRFLYKKKTGSINEDKAARMKKEYVGKRFYIMAYETGEFRGLPNGYFKYQPVRQDFGFHFKRYLVVVADKTGA
jgi:hypothetical protein